MLNRFAHVGGFHIPMGARVTILVCLCVLAISFLGVLGRDATYGKPGATVAGAVEEMVATAQATAREARATAAQKQQALGLLAAAEILTKGDLQKHTEVRIVDLKAALMAAAVIETGPQPAPKAHTASSSSAAAAWWEEEEAEEAGEAPRRPRKAKSSAAV